MSKKCGASIRYVSFRIRPFVYKELLEYAGQLGRQMSVTDYLVWGGFPKRLEFASPDEQRRYINDLDSTIVQNDIINRYKIRKADEFKKLANFILISNSRVYSAGLYERKRNELHREHRPKMDRIPFRSIHH